MLEVASQMASAMDCYEDMFKEITRKLYGEEEDVDFESEGFKSVEHLTAAFGLATRSHLKSETPSVVQPKTSPVTEPQESPTTATAPTPPTTVSAKRYNCAHCPYATDRRDLFTRHENIHREDKPFQCYVCMKQFNRADHVKKHFLRMHREHTYDLNRIRKQPPKNASGMSFYHKYNESQTPGATTNLQTQNIQNTQQQINIPTGIVNSMAPRAGAGATTNQTTTFKTELEPINNTTPKSTTTKSSNSKSSSSSNKKKGEKKFSCCYCTWTGVDNWCLKRHLNTHLKPFVCMLCDYKAARSERLTTHILKVHNKRACTRCNFLADDQAALTLHIQENHPLDHRNNRNVHNRSSHNNSSNSTNNSTSLTPISSTFGYETNSQLSIKQEIDQIHDLNVVQYLSVCMDDKQINSEEELEPQSSEIIHSLNNSSDESRLSICMDDRQINSEEELESHPSEIIYPVNNYNNESLHSSSEEDELSQQMPIKRFVPISLVSNGQIDTINAVQSFNSFNDSQSSSEDDELDPPPIKRFVVPIIPHRDRMIKKRVSPKR